MPFIRLGIGEIQPWDEALYGVRANACLAFGAWIDQSRYAVGHLYSATHPPLAVWAIALSKYLLGDSTFALRLPSAIVSSISVFVTFATLKRISTRSGALLGALTLACSDLFLLYSHRAQTDSFVLFFSLAAIYSGFCFVVDDSWAYGVACSAALAAALLSKFAVGIYVLPFLLAIPWCTGHTRKTLRLILIAAIALIGASSWYFYMLSHHWDYWVHVTNSLGAIQQGGYTRTSTTWWYYINRLLIGAPLLPLALLGYRQKDKWLLCLGLWLLVVLITMSSIGTRMPHFALLLIAPAALLVGRALTHYKRTPPRLRLVLVILASVLISWAGSEQIRLLVAARIPLSQIELPWLLDAVMVTAAGIAIWLLRRNLAYVFAVALLIAPILHLTNEMGSTVTNGAAAAAQVLVESGKRHLIVAHADFPNEEYVPQLAYYTNGWTLGWQAGRTASMMTWDQLANSADQTDTLNSAVVIARFRDRFYKAPAAETNLISGIDRRLQKQFRHRLTTRSYLVYY